MGEGCTEVIAVFFGGELGAGLVGDEVAEGAGLALEFARLVGPVGDAAAFLLFLYVRTQVNKSLSLRWRERFVHTSIAFAVDVVVMLR